MSALVVFFLIVSQQTQTEENLRQSAAGVLSSLGIFYYEHRQAEKAIEALEDALRYQPNDPGIRTNLAMVYYQAGKFPKVVELLEAKLTEPSQRALTALAVSCFALARYGDSARYYEALSKSVTDDPVLLVTLAAVYQLGGDADKAEAVLSRLPDTPLTRAQFYVVLGDAHRNQTQVAEAIAAYEKAVSLSNQLPGVNYWLGVLYSDSHEYGKAAAAFGRELELDPRNAEAAASFGAYYLTHGNDMVRARGYFEQALRNAPGHLGAQLGMIKVLLAEGKPADAFAAAERALAGGATDEELHYLKARALNLLGRKEEAQKELDVFRELRSKKP